MRIVETFQIDRGCACILRCFPAVTAWLRSGIGNKGVAAIEFALLLPVLMVLVLGMVDITRYVISAMKLERVTSGTADVGTQFKTLKDGTTVVTGNEVAVLFLAATEIAQPLDMDQLGAVIITCVGYNSDTKKPVVMWQKRQGRNDVVSTVSSGSAVTLPAGFILRDRDSVLFVEAAYKLHPYVFSLNFLSKTDKAVDLRSIAAYRPRFSALTTLDP